MKRLKMIGLFMGLAGCIYSQKPDNYDSELMVMYKHSVELVTVNDLLQIMESNPEVILLDTREINEYKVSHIDGSIYVGSNSFSPDLLKDVPRDAEIVVYCSVGVRSEKIGEMLKESGYQNIKNLYGGIFEWKYQDHPVVDSTGKTTDNIHTYDEKWSQWLLKGNKVY
jgi:rhodanese-related sulfurtransferase